jgi:transcriptional regulator with XRE-family HTH domain
MSFGAFMAQLGSVVRARRKALGWTQEELANRVDGMDQAAISRIESGDQGLRTETLFNLAEALKVPVYRLFGGNDPTKQPKAQPLRAAAGATERGGQPATLTDSLFKTVERVVNEQGPDEAARLLIGAVNSLLGERKKPRGQPRRHTAKTAVQRRTTKEKA